ncbi:uncharacterized protein LOC120473795 [Pimephales promelas]|uniref:uncharacterized protein LOC120473795 n=1 Tax=Pimephales promelas TaxID=90988 RepID=UPI0019556D76|nr:uncharacterized protein LOC120473795 [Pimephales promelas]
MRLLRCQMEKLQPPIVHREMHLEHALPLNEDNELLDYGEITCVNAQDRIQTETQCSGAENTFLEPEALASMQSAQAFVCSLHPQLQCEEYGPNAVSGGPAGAITPDIDIRPFSDMNPVHTPHANPPWPALAPHANPVAAVPHRNQFWPTYTPPQHFNPAFNLNPALNLNHEFDLNLEFNLESVFNLDPAFNLNPGFNCNPGFNLNPAFHLNPGFNCNPGFNFNPGFNLKPAFNFNPGFNCNPGFNLNPAFNLNPGFNCNPGFNLNPGFNCNPGFNLNPAFNLNPGFNCNPEFNLNPAFNINPAFNPLVACGDSALSCLVLRPHMSVCPTPYPHLNTTGLVSNTHSHSHTQSFPLNMLDAYELWQRLCKTAEDYSSSSPDTEALACFFIDVFRRQAVHSPDLPFSHAVHTAVEQWRKIPPLQRKQYHVTAKMFINLKKLNQRANRADGHQSIPTGNVKKKSKRAKKAGPVEDLAESALAEYSQVMDAPGSKVSDGSEVTAANEEDVCAQFLNQLFNHCESTNEAGFDMDYISSLLSTDHNLTDVLKENCQDLFSSSIPKPVAGCSNWTPQRDFSQYNGSHLQDHMMQESFRINTPTGMENGGQNAFQSSQGESIHSAFQDFGPAGNSPGGKGETLFVTELETTVQSECFSLQNYKSHHASFTHSIKRPKNPANGGVNHDGERNTLARQKTEKMVSTKEKRNKNTDIPLDSQRNNRAKTQTSVKETPEKKNANQNKKRQRQRRGRKQEKVITALDERTTDDKRKTAENQRNRNTQGGQRKSATKHGAKETDLFKITTEREESRQRTDVTKARKVRRDDEIKRRQRPIKKTGKSSRQKTQTETNDGKERQKWAIGENGDGFPIGTRWDATKTHSNHQRRGLRRIKVDESNKKST